ncbi:serine hydrolase [Paractinoplanes abujensis]|uniref:D-alanyl-D-alanine carboxypeptidase n=1 Tax=Paractinoplanes abujensis TaxID=882441 RepID=A0A7W7CUK4_9ACTN|nr:serine hydrolase domain-containing protein [Actinoplanes abujensis]MBB4694714.1 D-alanyl-D-alanine carboxypeptidase [Actinoplanes abujensis]GID20074.1 serine hydrolase [Actinoplanes abujensis]
MMNVLATTMVAATLTIPGGGPAATLQRQADELRRQGAPAVLLEVDTDRRDLRVRSGDVPWRAHFRIGSFTKTYVAATLLQLVGEGKLTLEDKVDTWLPGLVRGNGNDGRQITVRQLLQHTSGLPDYLAGMPYLFDQRLFEQHRYEGITSREAVRLALTFPREFAPGTSWNYSNTNYMLAGLIIEKVTGHSWRTAVRDRIVRPLGLTETTLPGNDPNVPNPHAVGYERFPGPDATPEDPDYGEPIDATRLNPTWGGAAGEIISTVDDGNTFLRALMRGRVLKPAQLAEMKRTVAVSDEFRANWPGARYGLGLVFVPNSCGGSWAHGGDIHGFKTRNGVKPDGSRSVVVTINTDSLKRDAGVPKPAHDVTLDIIDTALCK